MHRCHISTTALIKFFIGETGFAGELICLTGAGTGETAALLDFGVPAIAAVKLFAGVVGDGCAAEGDGLATAIKLGVEETMAMFADAGTGALAGTAICDGTAVRAGVGHSVGDGVGERVGVIVGLFEIAGVF